jgi:hypothetical protein
MLRIMNRAPVRDTPIRHHVIQSCNQPCPLAHRRRDSDAHRSGLKRALQRFSHKGAWPGPRPQAGHRLGQRSVGL